MVVLAQKGLEVGKGFLDTFGQISDSLRLRGTNSPENSLGCQQDLAAEVVAAHALGVGHAVDLAQDLDQLRALLCVLGSVYHNATARFFLLLDLRKVFIGLDGLSDVTPGIGLDEHELKDVDLLVVDPGLVEVVQVLRHILNYVLHRDVHRVFYDTLIQVPNDVLNNAELLE